MSFFNHLDPEAYDRRYGDVLLARRIARYFAPYRRGLALIALTLFLTALLETSLPVVIAWSVNALSGELTAGLIAGAVGVVAAAGVGEWVLNYFRRRLLTRVVGDLILALRSDAFRATIAHDLSFFDENASGRIVSRITSDTQDFANVAVLVGDTVSQLTAVLLLTLILLRADPGLTLVLWLSTLPVLFIAVGFRRLARYVTRQGNRALANLNAAIQETISGIAVAKNFRQEGVIYDEFRVVNRQAYAVNVRRGLVLSGVFPVLWAIAGGATALLVFRGGHAVMAGALAAAAWFLFVQSVDRFYFPFLNLASFWPQVQAGLSAAERVFALIDAEPVVKQIAQNPVPPLRGEIEFERVGFHYTSKAIVLRDFSLSIRAGETIALVGHTGAGKSSIAKLIARFYEFQEGRLRIDGRDIRTFDLRDYRRQLGIVSQVPFLFAGTVADNIRYARPEITDAEIAALGRQVGNGEWLETLPDGLRTDVGQRGAKLSMGQRQLVALMRVLVQRPAIFILDEATASVDPFTEEQIQEALDLILHQSTAIIIAHRLSTVRNADRIIVLKQGQIIEAGNHNALLRQGGHYAELYNTYFRHQSLEYIASSRQRALMPDAVGVD
jgi:ATP-binding cassette subfamily B protein